VGEGAATATAAMDAADTGETPQLLRFLLGGSLLAILRDSSRI